jgi:hypothetical protein
MKAPSYSRSQFCKRAQQGFGRQSKIFIQKNKNSLAIDSCYAQRRITKVIDKLAGVILFSLKLRKGLINPIGYRLLNFHFSSAE